VSADLRCLGRALGYRFERPELLLRALTHRSAGGENNERLEFLGDALLGFVIAEALLERYPDADEGRLSRLRASLVKMESLARLARGLELGEYLRLGAGELRTGGFARDSILADSLEAVFGAVYLDRGFAAAKAVILSQFASSLERVGELRVTKDPKTRLQELLQADHRPLPEYEVMGVSGSQHAQSFHVRCTLADASGMADGHGTSRRRAEQQAAQHMLELLQNEA
jgi:ribonuclease-3